MSAAVDIIVVGSGPAGVSVAWPLVRAGLRVSMIDASAVSPALSSTSSDAGDCLSDAEKSSDLSPKFSLPPVRRAIRDFIARNQIDVRGFFAAGSMARGGLSTIWGALTERFDDQELGGYPFDAVDLETSYKAVISRIGVSGGKEAPLDVVRSQPAKRLLGRYMARPKDVEFDLHPARNAILQQAVEERQPCNQCGKCLFGCARGSIYDSSLELRALQRHPNFAYEAGNFVRSLHADGSDHILIVSSEGGHRQFRAPMIALAAGAIATTGLILRRLGWLDRSVRLFSNPSAASAFLAPSFIGRELPRETVALGQLFYRIRNADVSAAGVIYGADALPISALAGRLPTSRPLALKAARAMAPALLIATTYLPGSLSRNSLRVEESGGQGRIVIEGEQTPEIGAAMQAAQKVLRRRFLRLGALPVPGSAKILQPGADAHYAGSIPMGGDGPLSTSRIGELRNCSGLFIVDGAALTSLPATHLTLTIMANADRIGHEIARRHGLLTRPSSSSRQAIA
jgi:choline dehydrogenase-like flavoprotein